MTEFEQQVAAALETTCPHSQSLNQCVACLPLRVAAAIQAAITEHRLNLEGDGYDWSSFEQEWSEKTALAALRGPTERTGA